MLTPLPLHQDSTAQKQEVSLSLHFSSSKRGWGTACPSSMVGHSVGALFWSCPMGIAGLNHWGYGCDEQCGRDCDNQHMDLGRTSSYLQCPRHNPNHSLCSSAEPSWGYILTRELRGMQTCLIWILKWRALQVLELRSTPRKGTESQPHLPWKGDFQAQLTTRAGDNTWSCTVQQCWSQDAGRADLPKNKDSTRHGTSPCCA